MGKFMNGIFLSMWLFINWVMNKDIEGFLSTIFCFITSPFFFIEEMNYNRKQEKLKKQKQFQIEIENDPDYQYGLKIVNKILKKETK